MGLEIINGEDTVSKEVMILLRHGKDIIFLRKDELIRLRKIIDTIKL